MLPNEDMPLAYVIATVVIALSLGSAAVAWLAGLF
jgi:hypothetical protein